MKLELLYAAVVEEAFAINMAEAELKEVKQVCLRS